MTSVRDVDGPKRRCFSVYRLSYRFNVTCEQLLQLIIVFSTESTVYTSTAWTSRGITSNNSKYVFGFSYHSVDIDNIMELSILIKAKCVYVCECGALKYRAHSSVGRESCLST